MKATLEQGTLADRRDFGGPIRANFPSARKDRAFQLTNVTYTPTSHIGRSLGPLFAHKEHFTNQIGPLESTILGIGP